ncbi:hypothetical protein CR513_38332, partial [Mucuna pruriens]
MRKDMHSEKCLTCKVANSKVSPHGLSKRGRDSIFMVIDASPVPNLFFKEVVRIHGLSKTIVSDRDSNFLGHFQRSLWSRLDWILHVEFAYNRVFNSTSSYSPFELAYGFNPLSSLDLFCLTVLMMKFVQRLHDKAKLHMEKKGDQYARSANKGRKEVIFNEGDLVWVHWRKERFPNLRRSKPLPRGDDPFKILKKINDNVYQVDMPQDFGGSTTFNVNDLTPCDASVEAPNLRTNSPQEEDDTYMEGATLELEGPITMGKLKRI